MYNLRSPSTKSLAMILVLSLVTSMFCLGPQNVFAQNINNTNIKNNNNISGGFLRFSNTTSGVTISYPSYWQESPGNNIISLISPLKTVGIKFVIMPFVNMSLEEFTSRRILTLRENLINFNINRSSTGEFLHSPAQTLIFTYGNGNNMSKILQVGTIKDNKAYIISYFADAVLFDTFLPTGLKIINSVQISTPAIKKASSTIKTAIESEKTNNQTQTRFVATVIKELPRSNTTTLGIESAHKNDWITANHDIFGTRTSDQTIIGKNNVNKLQVKWILHSDFTIENPPLIVGDRGYIIDNGMRIMAFDANTGLNIWKYDLNSKPVIGSHGLTYDNGIIFAGTGMNATVVAINATDGKLIWESLPIDLPGGYSTPAPPTVWKDIVIEGNAFGDTPGIKGKVTAFNRTNGEKIWSIQTTRGPWVQGKNAIINGGAATWSGGSLDTKTGIYYVTTGNPSPDLDASTRPGPNLWADSILALDARTGHLIWGNQILKHDVHDWDAGWGNSLATVGDKRIVIGGTKRGDAYALDAANGNIVWKLPVGIQRNTEVQNKPNGTVPVWPGDAQGVQDYTANDNKTAYFAVSNMGYSYTLRGSTPVQHAIANGVGNGTVTAIDIKTGKIKWVYPTEFPTRVSPAVTNGVLFSGQMTAIGTPYKYDTETGITSTPLNPSGIIFALDKDTGKKLWEFNVGAPIGIGGPSIGHGMLFVTTGLPSEFASPKGGDIIAFGLPTENQTQSKDNIAK